MRISRRAASVQPSVTLAITARAAALRRAGVDIIGFGAGEPDFDTPAAIKEAAVRALHNGATKYTAVEGIPELRQAVAEELGRAHGVRYAAEEILVSGGAKQSLYNLFMALCDDGDEVIVPTPCWLSHTEIVSMAGGVPVLLPLSPESGFALDVEGLARRITERTRAILLCSPSNPTGAVYDEASMVALARLLVGLRRPDLLLVTDDLYRRLVYPPARWHSVLEVAPELRDRVVLIDGVSKTYAMTGWRIGFCAAPRPLIEAMAVLQGQTTTHPAAVAQHAALAALTGDQTVVAQMAGEFDRRRQRMFQLLGEIPGLSCAEPHGAFYCFPDVRAFLRQGGTKTDSELAEWLLIHAQIAAVPGEAFFGPGHLRFSYATSMRNIEEGMGRLKAGLAKLEKS